VLSDSYLANNTLSRGQQLKIQYRMHVKIQICSACLRTVVLGNQHTTHSSAEV